jgi:hypothetical protein
VNTSQLQLRREKFDDDDDDDDDDNNNNNNNKLIYSVKTQHIQYQYGYMFRSLPRQSLSKHISIEGTISALFTLWNPYCEQDVHKNNYISL